MAKKKSNNGQKKGVQLTPERIFFYALGIGVVGGALWIAWKSFKKKDEDTGGTITENIGSGTGSKSVARNDKFPLQRGSKGMKVMMLQQALAIILNDKNFSSYGGVDGDFGPKTETAIKAAGYPTVIDERTYNEITSSITGKLYISFNPSEVADRLYGYAQLKNLEGVMGELKKIGTTSQYTSVNDYYKKKGFVSKTIVTDLLNNAFGNDEDAKENIRQEFFRIGLKLNQSTGKWSLSGIPTVKDIVTLADTFVKDKQGNYILVKKNVILGAERKKANGYTQFESLQGITYTVPSAMVGYVNN